MTFKVTQYVTDYVKVGEEYKQVEATVEYESYNYDDLQNFLLSMVENAVKPVKFQVRKENE